MGEQAAGRRRVYGDEVNTSILSKGEVFITYNRFSDTITLQLLSGKSSADAEPHLEIENGEMSAELDINLCRDKETHSVLKLKAGERTSRIVQDRAGVRVAE